MFINDSIMGVKRNKKVKANQVPVSANVSMTKPGGISVVDFSLTPN